MMMLFADVLVCEYQNINVLGRFRFKFEKNEFVNYL